MPQCLSEGVDIFLKSVERQGESGHDVRVSRSAPWMARVGGPVIMKTAVSLFIRKFTPGDVTSRRDVPFAVSVRGFFTNSQVIIKNPGAFAPGLASIILISRCLCCTLRWFCRRRRILPWRCSPASSSSTSADPRNQQMPDPLP